MVQLQKKSFMGCAKVKWAILPFAKQQGGKHLIILQNFTLNKSIIGLQLKDKRKLK